MQQKKNSFSGSIGFVLAAAGSAVGVGNIWRFPYLCAKDGGGLFLIIYLVLVLTFGFVLLTTDIAIGRKTKKNALNAYAAISSKWKFLGYLTFLVPALIMTYYSVIGGWIVKYLTAYVVSGTEAPAQDGYFTSFITSNAAPIVFMFIFLALTAWVVYLGVEKGIEKYSRILMPILLILIIGIAIFSLTLSYETEDGTVRTGLHGLAIYLIPNVEGLTVKRFLEILLDAMSQLFFSLSVSMGIMITYGSYMKKDVSIEGSTKNVEVFDTAIAIMAGLMIIPAVFAFSGGDPDTLQAGPALMFITIPKVFASMGLGTPIGILFFVLVLCAALTSSIALTESAVSTFQDELRWHRKKATVIVGVIMILLGTLSSLGYGPLGFVKIIGMQFLDFFDFLTNSVMMPIAALATCLLISRKVGVEKIEEEVVAEGGTFRRKKIFNFMIKYLCPIFAAIILLSSVANAFGLISM